MKITKISVNHDKTFTVEVAQAQASSTTTYYNGGVEGRSFSAWYDRVLAVEMPRLMSQPAAVATNSPASNDPARLSKPDSDALSNLCTNCSLCCNGSLFKRLPITLEESRRLGDGIDVFPKGGELRMRLGCTRLGNDGCCKAYAIRPAICSSYRCGLLKKAAAGEIEPEFAARVVHETKAMQERAIQAFQTAMPENLEISAEKTALAAVERYREGRGKGMDVRPHARANAWLHFEYFEKFVEINFSVRLES